MKALIFPHGNKDDMSTYIRKDSSTSQFDFIRLLLALTTMGTATTSCYWRR